MTRRFQLTAVLVVTLLMACAPSPAPSSPTAPGATVTQPLLVLPTAVPSGPPTPVTCAVGYTLYADDEMGFSACYPKGWVVSRAVQDEMDFVQVTFSPAAGMDGAGLRLISVSTSPAQAEFADQDFLNDIENWLLQEYYDRLLVRPNMTAVDGHRAVDAAYTANVVLRYQAVELTRWITALRAHGQQWFIDVAGRSEARSELERIRAQFLAQFHVMSRSSESG